MKKLIFICAIIACSVAEEQKFDKSIFQVQMGLGFSFRSSEKFFNYYEETISDDIISYGNRYGNNLSSFQPTFSIKFLKNIPKTKNLHYYFSGNWHEELYVFKYNDEEQDTLDTNLWAHNMNLSLGLSFELYEKSISPILAVGISKYYLLFSNYGSDISNGMEMFEGIRIRLKQYIINAGAKQWHTGTDWYYMNNGFEVNFGYVF